MRRTSCVGGCGIVRRLWVVTELDMGGLDRRTLFSHGNDNLDLATARIDIRRRHGLRPMTVPKQTALSEGLRAMSRPTAPYDESQPDSIARVAHAPIASPHAERRVEQPPWFAWDNLSTIIRLYCTRTFWVLGRGRYGKDSSKEPQDGTYRLVLSRQQGAKRGTE
jgi:hypothetical protein